MKIAIIGGGASGIALSYLLNNKHHVTLFEKSSILGGNVRTLNKNVPCENLKKNIVIENGVLGIHLHSSPTFSQLMNELDIDYKVITAPGSNITLNNKKSHPIDGFIKSFPLSDIAKFSIKLAKYKIQQKKIALGTIVDKEFLYNQWLRAIVMLSFSTPYQQTFDFPVEQSINKLYQMAFHPLWIIIKGGVYTYLEKALSRAHADVRLNIDIKTIQRNDQGIIITTHNNEEHYFDKIVFATPPDKILPMLKDATTQEKSCLCVWKSNIIKTIAHSDNKLYLQHGINNPTTTDFFQNQDNSFGYNTYMNDVYGLNKDNYYSFAYNLDSQINEQKMFDIQYHHMPVYNLAAMESKKKITAMNGKNNTYFIGAYLYDGLQEGAIFSANIVSKLLEGNIIATRSNSNFKRQLDIKIQKLFANE